MAHTTITVRLNAALGEVVAENIGETGVYENVREYLRDLLEESQGKIAVAAEVAEVHPKSLSRLLRRYQVRYQDS